MINVGGYGSDGKYPRGIVLLIAFVSIQALVHKLVHALLYTVV